MINKNLVTTAMEIIGAILVVGGIATFSVPISVIISGIILIVSGGLAV